VKQWKNVRFRTGNQDSHGYADTKRPLANFQAMPQEKVVNVLRKESKKWIDGLTEKEKRAIRKYTYNSGDKKPNRFFERLNAMLRGDIAEDKKLREYADIISGALQKNRLNHDVVCYRSMDFDPYEKYKTGEIFTDSQFISTLITEKTALNKDFKLVFFVPKSLHSGYIEPLSKFPTQRELLLDKDCKLRVLSRQKNKIILEVIQL
jgi:hypothetical protein